MTYIRMLGTAIINTEIIPNEIIRFVLFLSMSFSGAKKKNRQHITIVK